MFKKGTLALVLMAAGNSERFHHSLPRSKRVKKQWLRIQNEPLWKKVLQDLKKCCSFDEVIICANSLEIPYMQRFCTDYERFVPGGDTRAQSLRNALNLIKSDYVFVTDTARCDIDFSVCRELLEDFEKWDCSVPFVTCTDTALYQQGVLNREEIRLIQTPQISKTALIREFLSHKDYADESSAMLENQARIRFVHGSQKMHKVTFLHDLDRLSWSSHFPAPSLDIFTGSGIDIHAFELGKPLMLGGVEIPSQRGLKAHSDGDALIHALIDALLGAIGAGDIGEWFPDTSEEFRGIDSKKLLEVVAGFVASVGYEIINVDLSILAQTPKITPHKSAILSMLSSLLNLPVHQINLKATTAEKMGFVGREEGVCAMANVSLKFIDWTQLKSIN